MKKSTLLGISIIGVSLICSGTYFEKKEEIKSDPSILIGETKEFDGEGWAYPAYSYTNSPTNEPKYKNTTTFRNVGSYSQKTATYDRINVEEVWESYRGESVKVAVIDTGCRTDHQEFDGTNISKDSYDIGNKTSTITDTSGHGTDTAACVAAAINGVGGTGIAPNVELYLIRAVNSTNTFPTEYLKSALNYCLENEVDVINMSIQGYPSAFSYEYVEDMNGQTYSDTVSPSMVKTTLDDEINACYEKGITVVGAAGNYNTTTPAYPAANDHVIAVASTGLNSETAKAGFSNYGDWVDVCAPGYVIVPGSTGTSSYSLNLGTSFSAPIVTGAIALYKSKYPSAKPDQIEKALKASCNKLTWSGSGAGQIDVKAFLDIAPESDVESVTLSEHEKTLTVGETYQLSATVLPSGANQELTYESSDSSICSVSNTGLVRGVAKGTATIKAISAGNSSKYDSVIINVEEAQSQFVEKEGTPTMTLDSEVVEKGGTVTGVNNGIKIGKGSTIKITVPEKATKLNFYLGAWNKESAQITIAPASNVSKTSITPSADAGISNNSPFTLSTNSMSAYKQTIELSNLTKDTDISFTTSSSKRAVIWNITYSYLEGSSQETPTLTGIQVSNSHRTFTVGETFVKETVTAIFSDGTTKDVTLSATFSGNNTSTSGTKTVTVSYTENGVPQTTTYTITVNAQTTTTYTVTFNANGHGSALSAVTVNAGGTVTEPSNPSATGWTFGGWYTDSGCTNAYNFNNAVSSSFTLYAKWTQNSSSTDDFDGYYDSILDSYTDETLKTKLHDLNTSKRKTTIGYDGLRTKFAVTDLDPNGSGKILGFYDNSLVGPSWDQGKTWNREHVWPDSLGGNKVEGDIHMVRPAKVSSNGERGNLYYGKNIYDPGSLGYENYRGIAARIIFYSAIADTSLNIIDANSGESNQMGKLSDLLEWNLTYLPSTSQDASVELKSEQYRNNAIASTSVQGNRNPFIDHPEYACKIWGNTSDATRQICSQTPVEDKNLVELEVTGSPTKTTYSADESFDPAGLTIIAKYDDGNTEDVTSKVKWSQLVSGESEVTGTYTYKTTHKSVTISGLTITASKVSYFDVIKSGALQKGYSSVGTYSSSSGYGSLYGTNYLTSGYVDLEGGSKIKVTCDIGTFGGYKTDGSQNLTIGLYDADGELISDTATFKPSKTNTKQGNDIVTCTLTLNSGKQSGFIRIVPNSLSTSGSFARLYNLNLEYTPYQEVGPQVKTITLSTNSLSFDLYNDVTPKTLNATVEADEGADTTIIWLSSDEDVATVENGVVTPHKEGNVIITAKSKSNPEIKDTCIVSVTDSSPKPVTGITLNETSLQLVIGSKFTLVCTITPSNATNKNVTWSSSDEDVATVSDGVVTSKAVGSATITVTTVDGGFTANCSINVSAAPVITYQLEADQETVPYMSGTNHQVSVGVKLYQYSNGVKGSQVVSGTGSVDTSVLGPAKISYTYQSVTYETSVKVTNNGAKIGSIPDVKVSGENFSTTMPDNWSSDGCGEYATNNAPYLLKMDATGDYFEYLPKNFSTNSKTINANVTLKMIGGASSSSFTVYALVRDGSGTIVTSSNIKSTISISGKQNDVKTNLSCTLNNSNGDTIYGIRYVFTKGSNVGVSCAEITFKGIQGDATSQEQAVAWSNYFIKLTGGGEFDGPCKLGTPEAKKAALQQVWGELKSEYVYMAEGSKTAFCSVDATETIAEAVQHYRYIVNTYGLEDFAKVPQVSSSNKLIPISNSSSFVVGIIAMVGLTAIGSYFIYKKRREE